MPNNSADYEAGPQEVKGPQKIDNSSHEIFKTLLYTELCVQDRD